MNLKQAKKLRILSRLQHWPVKLDYFLHSHPQNPVYPDRHTTEVRVSEFCERGTYRNFKRKYKNNPWPMPSLKRIHQGRS